MKRTLLTLMVLLPAAAVQSADFDYAHYQAILGRHLRTGVVIDGITLNAMEYAALSAESRQEDADWNLLLRDLAAFDPEGLPGREEKMAFWINVYNIAAIKTILDFYPVGSIRSLRINWLGLPWDRKAINVGGREYSLGEIEHDILLAGFRDLRIHFGINCASVSCVDLRPEPFRGRDLFGQLEEQGRVFLANQGKGMRIDRAGGKVYLSQIFKFGRKDFEAWAGGAVRFILAYIPAGDADLLRDGSFRLEYLDYDWNVNDSRNAR